MPGNSVRICQKGCRADSTSVTISSYHSPDWRPVNLSTAATRTVASNTTAHRHSTPRSEVGGMLGLPRPNRDDQFEVRVVVIQVGRCHFFSHDAVKMTAAGQDISIGTDLDVGPRKRVGEE